MQDVEEIVYAVGEAIVGPSLGQAELIVALLVAIAFAASAVKTWLGRDPEEEPGQPRFERAAVREPRSSPGTGGRTAR